MSGVHFCWFRVFKIFRLSVVGVEFPPWSPLFLKSRHFGVSFLKKNTLYILRNHTFKESDANSGFFHSFDFSEFPPFLFKHQRNRSPLNKKKEAFEIFSSPHSDWKYENVLINAISQRKKTRKCWVSIGKVRCWVLFGQSTLAPPTKRRKDLLVLEISIVIILTPVSAPTMETRKPATYSSTSCKTC